MTAVVGAAQAQSYPENGIPFEVSAETGDLNKPLNSNEVAMLRDECNSLGGAFPSNWAHLGENAFQEGRVIFFHNFKAGSNAQGGGICLTY